MLLKEFTEPECEHLRKMCNFTEEERAVFDMRVKGRSIIETCLALNMSESTVNRRVAAVKKKIVRVL